MKIDQIASAMDSACGLAVLPNPGVVVAHAGDNNKADSVAYIKAVKSRLAMLGYMRYMANPSAGIDLEYSTAVKQFQSDIELKVDGWLGPKSWEVLQKLVAFEDEQDVLQWNLSLKSPAIYRAIYLRLHSFGLFKRWQRHRLDQDTNLQKVRPRFNSAKRLFIEIGRQIGIFPAQGSISFEQFAIALFNQDELVKALDSHPQFLKQQQYSIFFESVARVELWLMGYKVKLRKDVSLDKSFPRRLKDFWSDNAGAKLVPKDKARVSSFFFRRLSLIHDGVESGELNMGPSSYSLTIRSMTEDQQSKVQKQLKGTVGRVWDGIKRAAAWLYGWVKKMLTSAVRMVKNVARLTARYARKMFQPVCQALDIVSYGIKFGSRRVFDESSVRRGFIEHDYNFDHRILLMSDQKMAAANQLIEKFKGKSLIYQAACTIIGNLIGLFRKMLAVVASGIFSWVKLLFALADLYQHWQLIKTAVDSVKQGQVKAEDSLYLSPVS